MIQRDGKRIWLPRKASERLAPLAAPVEAYVEALGRVRAQALASSANGRLARQALAEAHEALATGWREILAYLEAQAATRDGLMGTARRLIITHEGRIASAWARQNAAQIGRAAALRFKAASGPMNKGSLPKVVKGYAGTRDPRRARETSPPLSKAESGAL